ncbi:hypothetical protein [Pedobacter antarcticus]|uniref:hypothetical protein n=1 Tax=Pedobacter antarcticus TaxID=34086 RepID=UPI00292F30E2|nr:hypothetical protein [Pedobacter antarcticus]
MNTVLKSGYVKARKNYHTDASCYFDFARYPREGGYRVSEFKDLGMTDEEIQAILEADKRKWRIEIGEVHYSQTGVYDGDLYSYRAPKLVHQICVKYDLYTED